MIKTKRKHGMFINTKYIDLVSGINKAKDLNLDYIQLYALNEKFNLASLSKNQINYLKEYISSLGIKVSSFAISFGSEGVLNCQKDRLISQYKEILEIGLEFGSKIITSHIGKIPSDNESHRYEKMQRICNEIGTISSNVNSVFAIETGTEKAMDLKTFINSINSNGLAVNYDPANIVMGTNEDPVVSLGLLANLITHTHIKDCKKFYSNNKPFFNEMAAGNGDIDFDSIFLMLDKIEFDGFNIIERNDYHDIENGIVQSAFYLKKYLFSKTAF